MIYSDGSAFRETERTPYTAPFGILVSARVCFAIVARGVSDWHTAGATLRPPRYDTVRRSLTTILILRANSVFDVAARWKRDLT